MFAARMGCIHSTSSDGIKKLGPETEAEGIPVKADPVLSPEILQLAEVSS